jgi:hypothetical protein
MSNGFASTLEISAKIIRDNLASPETARNLIQERLRISGETQPQDNAYVQNMRDGFLSALAGLVLIARPRKTDLSIERALAAEFLQADFYDLLINQANVIQERGQARIELSLLIGSCGRAEFIFYLTERPSAERQILRCARAFRLAEKLIQDEERHESRQRARHEITPYFDVVSDGSGAPRR